MFVRDDEKYLNNNSRLPLYTTMWSETNKGNFPLIYKTSRNSQTKEKHNILNIEKYNGKVWCFEVPTGLFITRRNGKITIQGNSSQYDKDFKIFTHAGVSVERVGANSAIMDVNPDITQLIKEMFIGLMVPSVVMDGSDITYNNGGIALDVLRQRYISFRNMLSLWLRKSIFAPICKIQGFFDYKDGKKKLMIPEVEWNHMSLFDTADYINILKDLTSGEDSAKRVSVHSLYKSIGLDYEDETRKIRKEAIQNAIALKEKAALQALDLNSLRALDEDDEIPAPAEETQAIAGMPGGAGGMEPPVPGQSGGGIPSLDLGSMPSMSSTAPSSPAPSSSMPSPA